MCRCVKLRIEWMTIDEDMHTLQCACIRRPPLTFSQTEQLEASLHKHATSFTPTMFQILMQQQIKARRVKTCYN